MNNYVLELSYIRVLCLTTLVVGDISSTSTHESKILGE